MWLSLVDYVSYRGLSLSTIRRYIKNDQVKYKKENGKYFVFVDEEKFKHRKIEEEKRLLELSLENQRLELENRRLKEENNELVMLVQIYEQQLDQNKENSIEL